MTLHDSQVLVVGGGAAGMAAAVSAAQDGAQTALVEKNEKLGKKVYITGHGRCNVTNVAPMSEYEQRVFRNPRFLRSALSRFGPKELLAFLEKAGVPTKKEDSGRVFPRSDKSSDVIRAFSRAMERLGVTMCLREDVRSVERRDNAFIVRTQNDVFRSVALVLATGGVSYSSTGSTGDGARIASKMGHSTVAWQPGLVGLVAKDPGSLQGLTIRGVLSLYEGDRRVAREDGEILFTHTGITGPAAFRASCHLSSSAPEQPLRAEIRLFPSRTEEQVREELMRAISAAPNKDLSTVLAEKIPKRLVATVLSQAGIEPGQKGNQLKKADRARLLGALVSLSIPLAGTRPMDEAIISIGGVSVRDVNPSTMESRKVPGLFFAGELLDVSAMTGGYNLQIAFSTGWLAGRSAAAYALGAR